MKLILLAALLAASVPARAGEQGELIACFDALRPYSQGFGESIGPWEWAPGVNYPTVAVPVDRSKAAGIYVYSEDQVYFADFGKVPRETRKTGWFPFQLGPLREGRGVFHCSYEAIPGSGERKIMCDLGEFLGDSRGPKGEKLPRGEKFYYPIGFTALEPSSENRSVLRTAVLSRIMSVTGGWFSKQAQKYARSLEAHKKRMAAGPSALAEAAGYLGLDLDWNRNAPNPPDREEPLRALAACARMQENDQLAEAARLEARLLDDFPLPR